MQGTGERPADVLAHGIGGHSRDIAIDLAVVDPQGTGTVIERRRRACMTSLAARRKEAMKRDARSHGGGPTMEERLRLRGMDCTPLIFEVDGGTTGTWARYLKKLSEIAHTRRGHNASYFAARWRTIMGMTLAKRGAQGAIRRSHKVQSQLAGNAFDATDDNAGLGPFGAFGVEAAVAMAADASASVEWAADGFFN